ncbi:hypothetical protein HHK36_016403 [Tetracentron sinense]|uniref:MBD domain-containing protein n=1 Tax=Tetracentron sinense TaxID=13715 RepID=A0A835DBX2_TETSI|nr:hypothetical protein HHK36_016403 [Tetracentron sinense]
MSAHETSGGDPNSYSHEPPESDPLPVIPSDAEPESDTLTAASIDDGKALIEAMIAEGGVEEAPEETQRIAEDPKPIVQLYSEAVESSSSAATRDTEPAPEADNFQTPNERKPAPEPEPEPVKSEPVSESRTPQQGKRGPAKMGSELAIVPLSRETPDWLPQGWRMEEKVRSSGATAGSKDRYFYDPISGRQFRSKKEVLCFMETGTSGRYKRKTKKNSDANVMSPGRSEGHKQKGSGSKRKGPRSNALNFDYINPPAKVEWVLTDSAEGSWTPFISDKRVPESSQREWAAAYSSITCKSTMFWRHPSG